jgi:hypothetical protein
LTAFADRVGDALVGTFALTRRELGELIGVLYQQSTTSASSSAARI